MFFRFKQKLLQIEEFNSYLANEAAEYKNRYLLQGTEQRYEKMKKCEQELNIYNKIIKKSLKESGNCRVEEAEKKG